MVAPMVIVVEGIRSQNNYSMRMDAVIGGLNL